MIVIVDYKMGNIGSIINMLKRLGVDAIASDKSSDIEQASKLILPGVGAFDTGMNNLNSLNLLNALNKKVLIDKTPILGICVGMQLMAKTSEEGATKGLGWLDADVKRFSFDGLNQKLCIPCMGWNIVKPQKLGNLFTQTDEERFYFVHSYHIVCHQSEDILATTNYGYDYTVAVNKANIYGVQFHPEKSHKFGLNLLRNFIEQVPPLVN